MSKITTLLTGSSGLLGEHLKIEALRPTHKELDITRPLPRIEGINLIIHSAAYTDVTKAETDRLECFKVNVLGTVNLFETYAKVPFVFISSEYAYNPVNYYSFTKEIAEKLLIERGNCLIIRTLFKPRPFPYPKAFTDQYTEGDYVDVIAPLIEEEIKKWDGKGRTIIYVGTGRKTIYDLAKQTRDVEPISVNDIKDVKLPKDYR